MPSFDFILLGARFMSGKIRILSFILLSLFLLIIVICPLSQLTLLKDSNELYGQFYEQPQDYDILFLGNSHARDGFCPMVIWEEQGFAAYNLASSSATIPVSWWTLVNAIDYTQPELVVLDCYRISHPEKLYSVPLLHKSMDAMPLSLNKLRAAVDLCQDFVGTVELIFPFTLYHARWDEVIQEDFQPERSYFNGYNF